MGLVLCSRGDAGLRDVFLKQEVKANKSSRIELNILEFSYLAQRFSGTPEECVRMLNRLAVNDKSVLDENYTGKGIVKLHDKAGDEYACIYPFRECEKSLPFSN